MLTFASEEIRLSKKDCIMKKRQSVRIVPFHREKDLINDAAHNIPDTI